MICRTAVTNVVSFPLQVYPNNPVITGRDLIFKFGAGREARPAPFQRKRTSHRR